jgi:Family of unknown function (DUF6152)
MRNTWRLIAALVLCIAVDPIWAHHSVKGTYDTSALLTLMGTVTKVDFVNPHVWFELTVKRENGQVITERVEIAAPRALIQRGFDKSFLGIGNSVSVEAWASKDSLSNHFSGRTLILADGRRVDVSDNWP